MEADSWVHQFTRFDEEAGRAVYRLTPVSRLLPRRKWAQAERELRERLALCSGNPVPAESLLEVVAAIVDKLDEGLELGDSQRWDATVALLTMAAHKAPDYIQAGTLTHEQWKAILCMGGYYRE